MSGGAMPFWEGSSRGTYSARRRGARGRRRCFGGKQRQKPVGDSWRRGVSKRRSRRAAGATIDVRRGGAAGGDVREKEQEKQSGRWGFNKRGRRWGRVRGAGGDVGGEVAAATCSRWAPVSYNYASVCLQVSSSVCVCARASVCVCSWCTQEEETHIQTLVPSSAKINK